MTPDEESVIAALDHAPSSADVLRVALLSALDDFTDYCGGDDWPNHMSQHMSKLVRNLRQALSIPLPSDRRPVA